MSRRGGRGLPATPLYGAQYPTSFNDGLRRTQSSFDVSRMDIQKYDFENPSIWRSSVIQMCHILRRTEIVDGTQRHFDAMRFLRIEYEMKPEVMAASLTRAAAQTSVVKQEPPAKKGASVSNTAVFSTPARTRTGGHAGETLFEEVREATTHGNRTPEKDAIGTLAEAMAEMQRAHREQLELQRDAFAELQASVLKTRSIQQGQFTQHATSAREPWVIDAELDTLVTERYCTFWHEGRQESPESWELRLILWYKMTTSVSDTGFEQNVYVGDIRTLWIRATSAAQPHTRNLFHTLSNQVRAHRKTTNINYVGWINKLDDLYTQLRVIKKEPDGDSKVFDLVSSFDDKRYDQTIREIKRHPAWDYDSCKRYILQQAYEIQDAFGSPSGGASRSQATGAEETDAGETDSSEAFNAERNKPEVCMKHITGKCSFGPKCRYFHLPQEAKARLHNYVLKAASKDDLQAALDGRNSNTRKSNENNTGKSVTFEDQEKKKKLCYNYRDHGTCDIEDCKYRHVMN